MYIYITVRIFVCTDILHKFTYELVIHMNISNMHTCRTTEHQLFILCQRRTKKTVHLFLEIKKSTEAIGNTTLYSLGSVYDINKQRRTGGKGFSTKMNHTIINPCIWGPLDTTKTIRISCTVLLATDIIPAVLTIVLNAVFITTLTKTRSLHTPSNVFLGAMCFSDILVGILVQPIFIGYQITIIANKESYLLRVSLRYSVIVVSGLSFIFASFVTADRYLAICRPFQYRQKASCKRHLTIAVVAGMCYTTIAAVMLIQRTYHFEGIVMCYLVFSFIGIIVSHVRIYKVVIKKRNVVINLGSITDGESKKEIIHERKERARTHIIGTILCFLILCYIPFAVMSAVAIIWRDQVCRSRETTVIASLWVGAFVLINSCINPILYFVMSNEFRSAARSIFYVCKRGSDVRNNNESKSYTERSYDK